MSFSLEIVRNEAELSDGFFELEKEYQQLSKPRQKKHQIEIKSWLFRLLENNKAGSMTALLLLREKKPLARLILFENYQLKEKVYGLIGFFYCVDDVKAASRIFQEAEELAKQKKLKALIGPINFSTWYDYRYPLDFSQGSFLGEPYCPAYFPGFWEAAGFEKWQRYFTARVSDIKAYLKWARPLEDQFIKQGYTIRRYRPWQRNKELKKLWDLSLKIFSANFLYSPLSWPLFKKKYGLLSYLLKPSHLLFAMDPKGRECGFILSYPDIDKEYRAWKKKAGLKNLFRLLLAVNKKERLIIKTLGVLPLMRRVLPGPVLISKAHQIAEKKGYREILHALMHEKNRSLVLSKIGAEEVQSYLLYKKELRNRI